MYWEKPNIASESMNMKGLRITIHFYLMFDYYFFFPMCPVTIFLKQPTLTFFQCSELNTADPHTPHQSSATGCYHF